MSGNIPGLQCRLASDFILESIQILSLNELDTEHKFNFIFFESTKIFYANGPNIADCI